MKVRESDIPAEEVWEGFFEPFEVLSALGIDGTVVDVAEFGCGYGTFTIPAATLISGDIYCDRHRAGNDQHGKGTRAGQRACEYSVNASRLYRRRVRTRRPERGLRDAF